MKNPPKRHESEIQSHGQLFDFGHIEKIKECESPSAKGVGQGTNLYRLAFWISNFGISVWTQLTKHILFLMCLLHFIEASEQNLEDFYNRAFFSCLLQ